MPIYEYECPKCGEFEITQRITENPLKKCPTCKSKVQKLISNTSFQLKGSGWYVTDYGGKKGAAAKDGSAKEASSSSDGDSKSESKSDAKGDSKSDTTSDTKSSAKESKPKDTSAKGSSARAA